MGQREPSSRTVVAVHQPLIRQGVHDLVAHAGLDPHPNEIFDFDSLLAFMSRMPVLALIILCFALPGLNGIQGMHRLRARFPNQPVLVIVEQPRRNTIMELISAGADGVVPLATDSDAMVRAMISVSSGAMYIPRVLDDDPASMDEARTNPPGPASQFSAASLGGLTERQREVLHWLAIGESNKTIGRRLNISPHTVNMHIRAVFRALGVHGRIEAVNKLAMLSLDTAPPNFNGWRRSEERRLSSAPDHPGAPDEPSFNFS